MEKLRRLKRRRNSHATPISHAPLDGSIHRNSRSRINFRNKLGLGYIREKTRQLPWRRILLWGGAGALLVLMLIQVLYPADRLLPLSRIDGTDLSWQKKSEATDRLNASYAKYPVSIYMTGDEKPVTAPNLKDLDVSVNNAERTEQLDYPWYLRIVPTSLFWAGLRGADDPQTTFGGKFTKFVNEKLMPNCKQAPIDATLRANGGKLEAVAERDGRTCAEADVQASIKKIQPRLDRKTSVHVGAKIQPASVTKSEAEVVAKAVNRHIVDGVKLAVNGQMVTIEPTDVASWLDFAPHDDTVDVVVNSDRAGSWLAANVAGKVTVQPGTSLITTRDFTEISRVNGASGQALDTTATIATIQQVVVGESQQASASTRVVPPNEKYTRTYSPSDQGLSALLANYAKDHQGTFGISLIELDGKKRRADYNGSKQFVTASTYKLFVAYSLLKRIDAGQRDWDSNATCFNKMISHSDNPCAESFLSSLGLSNVTKDIQAIGLTSSTFMKSGGPFTTANDLTLLLGMIATGQNFSPANQQRLVAAMKANVYRKGIPAGASGQVADKVGFLDGLLHDAAIVYSPSGTYVLAIMTDGSSWATIADLTRQIDSLRAQ